MVLPKEIREKAAKICCVTLLKGEEFGDMVKGLLGPMMKEMTSATH